MRNLEEQVRDALRGKLETESLDIHPIIYGSKVILTGMVDVLADKMAAEDAIRQVAGVAEIENDLTVATDGEISDKDIQEAVERKLVSNDLPVVGITVNAGVVSLRGTVHSPDQQQGIVTSIQEVMGVRAVDSKQLRIN